MSFKKRKEIDRDHMLTKPTAEQISIHLNNLLTAYHRDELIDVIKIIFNHHKITKIKSKELRGEK